MGDVIDLTGDGGVLKQIVRSAKPDAISPSDDLPVVDGMFIYCLFYSQSCVWWRIITMFDLY